MIGQGLGQPTRAADHTGRQRHQHDQVRHHRLFAVLERPRRHITHDRPLVQKAEHDRVGQAVLPENTDARETGISVEIMKHLPRVTGQIIPKHIEAAEVRKAQPQNQPSGDEQHHPLEKVGHDHARLPAARHIRHRHQCHNHRADENIPPEQMVQHLPHREQVHADVADHVHHQAHRRPKSDFRVKALPKILGDRRDAGEIQNRQPAKQQQRKIKPVVAVRLRTR